MKTNVDKLKALQSLGDVRQRLGADGENDKSQDERINSMSNFELVGAYSAWHLGTNDWWVSMKIMFDELEDDQ